MLSARFASRLLRSTGRRNYNFASSTYVSAFGDLPTPSFDTLRSQALKYLQDDFKKESWSSDPVTTILAGVPLQSGSVSDTVDAFGGVNGKIRHASEQEIDRIIEHVNSYTPPVIDCRTAVRAIEDELLSVYPGLLIGNQAVDFLKQDGVTEIEESIQANVVERRMNDSLLSDEQAGLVVIDRSPAFVGCVSNFSNFLDLFRKVLRNIELGVPCVVLSRTNTTQHSYRWTALLVELMAKHGVDAGMLTYASSDLEGVKRILGSSPPTCPSYFTCSRDLAMAVKSARPNTVCSTGGPNTLVAPSLTPGAREAIRFSAGIENSGQCTALRHAVVGGGATKEDVEGIFEGAPVVDSPEDSLERGEFSGVFPHSPMHPTPPGYTSVPSYPARYKISGDLPEDGLEEYWRNVFVDVTSTEGKVEAGTEEAEGLAKWLVRNQPITLAVNEDTALAKELFEKTGQVVYTVGGEDGGYALTCQARPQEGEIFGEFPVRRTLSSYTKYPVIVPSSTPSYNALMDKSYLAEVGSSSHPPSLPSAASKLIDAVKDVTVKGYCRVVGSYLSDAVGPKRGYGQRTALWGLQRPPLSGSVTAARVGSDLDACAAKLVPFVATNARGQLEVSVTPGSEAEAVLRGVEGLMVTAESEEEWEARSGAEAHYNVITAEDGLGAETFPLPGHFVSLYLGVGHIKSTKGEDEEFVEVFEGSEKWLKMAA